METMTEEQRALREAMRIQRDEAVKAYARAAESLAAVREERDKAFAELAKARNEIEELHKEVHQRDKQYETARAELESSRRLLTQFGAGVPGAAEIQTMTSALYRLCKSFEERISSLQQIARHEYGGLDERRIFVEVLVQAEDVLARVSSTAVLCQSDLQKLTGEMSALEQLHRHLTSRIPPGPMPPPFNEETDDEA